MDYVLEAYVNINTHGEETEEAPLLAGHRRVRSAVGTIHDLSLPLPLCRMMSIDPSREDSATCIVLTYNYIYCTELTCTINYELFPQWQVHSPVASLPNSVSYTRESDHHWLP